MWTCWTVYAVYCESVIMFKGREKSDKTVIIAGKLAFCTYKYGVCNTLEISFFLRIILNVLASIYEVFKAYAMFNQKVHA